MTATADVRPATCRVCGADVLTYTDGAYGEFLAVDATAVTAKQAAQAVLAGRGACHYYPDEYRADGHRPAQLTRLIPLTVRDRLLGLRVPGRIHLDHHCPKEPTP